MKKIIFVLMCLPILGFGQCISRDCEKGYGTYYSLPGDSEGDSYKGTWKDGLRDGSGTYTFKSGQKYVGEWKGNRSHQTCKNFVHYW